MLSPLSVSSASFATLITAGKRGLTCSTNPGDLSRTLDKWTPHTELKNWVKKQVV